MLENPQNNSLNDLQKQLRNKTVALFKNNILDPLWVVLFMHDNKEFKGKKMQLYNYKAGKSTPSPETLEKLEKWVSKNKFSKSKKIKCHS